MFANGAYKTRAVSLDLEVLGFSGSSEVNYWGFGFPLEEVVEGVLDASPETWSSADWIQFT